MPHARSILDLTPVESGVRRVVVGRQLATQSFSSLLYSSFSKARVRQINLEAALAKSSLGPAVHLSPRNLVEELQSAAGSRKDALAQQRSFSTTGKVVKIRVRLYGNSSH
jgi:hypothetical protein